MRARPIVLATLLVLTACDAAEQDPTTTTVATIDVEFRDGMVISGATRFPVDRDDVVDIWVQSDVAEELHVHGYDIFFDLEPGALLNVTFVAEVPGIFDVELESGHTLLFEIEVSG